MHCVCVCVLSCCIMRYEVFYVSPLKWRLMHRLLSQPSSFVYRGRCEASPYFFEIRIRGKILSTKVKDKVSTQTHTWLSYFHHFDDTFTWLIFPSSPTCWTRSRSLKSRLNLFVSYQNFPHPPTSPLKRSYGRICPRCFTLCWSTTALNIRTLRSSPAVPIGWTKPVIRKTSIIRRSSEEAQRQSRAQKGQPRPSRSNKRLGASLAYNPLLALAPAWHSSYQAPVLQTSDL